MPGKPPAARCAELIAAAKSVAESPHPRTNTQAAARTEKIPGKPPTPRPSRQTTAESTSQTKAPAKKAKTRQQTPSLPTMSRPNRRDFQRSRNRPRPWSSPQIAFRKESRCLLRPILLCELCALCVKSFFQTRCLTQEIADSTKSPQLISRHAASRDESC